MFLNKWWRRCRRSKYQMYINLQPLHYLCPECGDPVLKQLVKHIQDWYCGTKYIDAGLRHEDHMIAGGHPFSPFIECPHGHMSKQAGRYSVVLRPNHRFRKDNGHGNRCGVRGCCSSWRLHPTPGSWLSLPDRRRSETIPPPGRLYPIDLANSRKIWHYAGSA